MGNGDTVSAGDLIVTKRNNRYIRLGGGTDFVQNNHRFTVTAVNPDGSLDAVQIGRGHPGQAARRVRRGRARAPRVRAHPRRLPGHDRRRPRRQTRTRPEGHRARPAHPGDDPQRGVPGDDPRASPRTTATSTPAAAAATRTR